MHSSHRRTQLTESMILFNSLPVWGAQPRACSFYDLNNKDMNPCERLKAELRLLPLITKMDPMLHSRKLVTRTCSFGDVSSVLKTFQTPLRQSGKEGSQEEGSPRQRRITVASYIPPSEEQNGVVTEKTDSTGVKVKTLEELNTEEVCQWFSGIGLQKCIPFIKGANLQGPQIATIDLDTLDLLQLTSVEERENFLSAVYRELHPQDTTTRILDNLLETIGPHDVEKFTAALVNLSNANSRQHSDCVNTPCQFQHSQTTKQQYS
ncbi:uncharacterized protein LOC121317223 isoform X2 [Polyodon spathula]|uniref:uncharacterized protein LOC121317223 isoform X2 n=1 Tax=Polyodon spathula TaxID=7913 RepID=UPI001B7DAFC6|nr:uncharacterized protein LOC121317223 isoform X2 [Polyodon spathula]XP_041108857.1 uncharacterized protein LOC121317223 isoform X2 [Polyodon spathula]